MDMRCACVQWCCYFKCDIIDIKRNYYSCIGQSVTKYNGKIHTYLRIWATVYDIPWHCIIVYRCTCISIQMYFRGSMYIH